MKSLQNLKTAKYELRAELCRRSFYRFFLEFWEIIEEAELVDNWHIKFLCDQLQAHAELVFEHKPKEKDIVINIPPSTTKTTICTIMFPAWIWSRMPSSRIISTSYSGTLSGSHSGKSKDIIQSEKYQNYFPYVEIRKDYDGRGYYMNTANGDRFSSSTRGTVTGKHAHFILVDDPINPEDAASEPKRLMANRFMTETLPSRKVDRKITLTVLIMQRLHVQDPTGYLLKRDPNNYKHICLPAEKDENISPKKVNEIYDENEGLLDPIRLSKKVLTQEKINLGSYGYAGQMQQRPAPKEGGVWKLSYIQKISEDDIPNLMDVGIDWDLAYTAKDRNSASAYIVSGTQNNRVYILDCGAVRYEFPELIQFMISMPYKHHYIENKASGHSAQQTLVKNNVNAVLTNVGDGDKISRTRDVTPYAEAGRVICVNYKYDYLFHDTDQGIIHLSESNYDIDLNDALTQAITRHIKNSLNPDLTELFEDKDLMRGR